MTKRIVEWMILFPTEGSRQTAALSFSFDQLLPGTDPVSPADLGRVTIGKSSVRNGEAGKPS
jgi:hypothetical protein